jgi:transposase InsO family protein
LIVCLEKFSSWIGSNQVSLVCKTDHRSLENWHTERLDCKSGPLGRRTRWHEFLSRFEDLGVEYIKGDENVVADSLSRWAYPACVDLGDRTFHGTVQDKLQVEKWDREENLYDGLTCHVSDYLHATGVNACSHDMFAPVGSTNVFADQHPNDPWGLHRMTQEEYLEPPDADVLGSLDRFTAQDFESTSCVSTVRDAESDTLELSCYAVPENVLWRTWHAEYKADKHWKDHWVALNHKTEVPSDYCVWNDRLRYRGKICVPDALAKEVATEVHSWGHASKKKTIELLTRRYTFAEAKPLKIVEDIYKHCDVCQVSKPRVGKQPGTRKFHPIPHHIFSSIAVDFVSLPDVKQGQGKNLQTFDGALVVVDRTSGYIVAKPMKKDGFTGESAARVFYESCFSFFGLPSEILSDNDVRLTSSFFHTLCALSGVEQHQSSAYTPQSNGRAENAVKAVVNICRRTLLELKRDWVENFPTCVFLMNSIPGVISEFSPHQIVFGRDPPYFGDTNDLHLPHSMSVEAESWLLNLKEKRVFIAKTLNKIHAEESAKFNDDHPPPTKFREGDRVLVRLRALERHKLDPVWCGPCEVLKHVHKDTYNVGGPQGPRQVVFADLKEYSEYKGKQRKLHYFEAKKGKEEFVVPDPVVDHIINHKGKGKTLRFRVKWMDFDNSHNTWEPLSHFLPGVNQDLLDYVKKKKVKVEINAVQENTAPEAEPSFEEGLYERFASCVVLNDPGEDSEPDQA